MITIEAVQRKAARFVLHDYIQQSSVTQMVQELGWQTLEDRCKDARLQLMYRILTGDVGIQADDYMQGIKGGRVTRGNGKQVS